MKRILLFTATSGLLYLTLSSNSVGPAAMGLNATGSPGSGTSCGGCHGGGPGTTTAAVEIRKLSAGPNSPIVTQYMPDTNYIVKIVGNHATLTHFGFQLTALRSSNTNAGTFSNLSGSVHSSTVGGKLIIEHAAQIAKTNNQYEATFNWKAPAAGTGTVTFYGIINAVDNNSQVGGDKPSSPFTKALTETTPASVGQFSADVKIVSYPNPVTDKLNITIENAESGAYTIRAFDMNGKILATHAANVEKKYNTTINTGTWASGIYHIKIAKGSLSQTITVTK